jgi:hypothetical protein
MLHAPPPRDVMPGIEEKKLWPLWAEHYPQWRESAQSKDVCLTITRIIKQQAARLIAGNDWSAKLNVTVASYNVPSDQFVEFVDNTTGQATTGRLLDSPSIPPSGHVFRGRYTS